MKGTVASSAPALTMSRRESFVASRSVTGSPPSSLRRGGPGRIVPVPVGQHWPDAVSRSPTRDDRDHTALVGPVNERRRAMRRLPTLVLIGSGADYLHG